MAKVIINDREETYEDGIRLVDIAAIHQDKLSNYEETFKDFARIVKISQEPEYLEQIENLTEVLSCARQV